MKRPIQLALQIIEQYNPADGKLDLSWSYLTDEDFKVIEPEIAKLEMLVDVNVSANRLQTFPYLFCTMPVLVRLNVGNNSITSIDNETPWDVPNLAQLVVAGNPMNALPSTVPFEQLEFLDIWDTEMSSKEIIRIGKLVSYNCEILTGTTSYTVSEPGSEEARDLFQSHPDSPQKLRYLRGGGFGISGETLKPAGFTAPVTQKSFGLRL